MAVDTDKLDYITELQQGIANQILGDAWCVAHEVKAYPENEKNIDFMIGSAIDKLGLVAIVTTPNLRYNGVNAQGINWAIDGLNIAITEMTTTNRSRANYATALSSAVKIAMILQKSKTAIPITINQQEAKDCLIVTASFKAAYQFVESVD